MELSCSSAQKLQIDVLAVQCVRVCPKPQHLVHRLGCTRSRTGHARLPMVSVELFCMIACLTFGDTLMTALPKSFGLYVNKMSNVPVLSGSLRCGLWVIISSRRLLLRSMCAGMCDIVILGWSGARPRASRPSSDFSSPAMAATSSVALNFKMILFSGVAVFCMVAGMFFWEMC